jgi:hypothetical protein
MRYSGKIIAPLLVIILVLPVFSYAETGKEDFKTLIRKERTLVVPGTGGEGVLLGEETSVATGSLSEENFTVSQLKKELDLYRDVLKIESPQRILFDRITFFPGLETVLLSRQGRICSIIGLSSQRVTSDSIDLEKGIEYILFSYGNERLVTLKNKSGTIYIYFDQGIAFVDDDSDNSLDMYILFKAG